MIGMKDMIDLESNLQGIECIWVEMIETDIMTEIEIMIAIEIVTRIDMREIVIVTVIVIVETIKTRREKEDTTTMQGRKMRDNDKDKVTNPSKDLIEEDE